MKSPGPTGVAGKAGVIAYRVRALVARTSGGARTWLGMKVTTSAYGEIPKVGDKQSPGLCWMPCDHHKKKKKKKRRRRRRRESSAGDFGRADIFDRAVAVDTVIVPSRCRVVTTVVLPGVV
ncbi:hypothetical protein AXG93_4324s1180 [Marchantia polymorpha subsp. ruderalis]|uniref:Uncharacterized protein n=1 Tax=Marchantia polymorpha subsp. ruderalis TaxID=1480154 RepID=A0A176W1B5_MARPO|nr:hypothetical protein AXG93_4324s1180 [Marchantia polymorpha subsp. ruderalis]